MIDTYVYFRCKQCPSSYFISQMKKYTPFVLVLKSIDKINKTWCDKWHWSPKISQSCFKTCLTYETFHPINLILKNAYNLVFKCDI
jgi:hypothetical protein